MKVNVSKKQIIACVLIVLLAAVVGGVGAAMIASPLPVATAITWKSPFLSWRTPVLISV